MSRVARLDSPGVLQHVIVRGNEKRKIFLDDQDRRRFLDRLFQLLGDCKALCYAWTLIPNHFHLLLLPSHFKLAVLMRRLLTGYAVTFNLPGNSWIRVFGDRIRAGVEFRSCWSEQSFKEGGVCISRKPGDQRNRAFSNRQIVNNVPFLFNIFIYLSTFLLRLRGNTRRFQTRR